MINKLMLSIFNLTLQINSQGKHHIFLQVFPHVEQITVELHKGGWIEKKKLDLKLECYYNNADAEKELTKINNILLQYLEF